MMKLNRKSLSNSEYIDSNTSSIPGVGIVHLGFGAFHKAHQAWLTDLVIKEQGGDWKIVGVNNWGAANKSISLSSTKNSISSQYLRRRGVVGPPSR